jgi:hypothetical protein
MNGRRRRTIRGILLLSLLSPGLFAGCRMAVHGGGDAGRPAIGSRLPSLLQEARIRNAPVDVAPPRGGWVVHVFSPGSAGSERSHGSVEALAGALPAGWILLAVPTGTREVPAFLERVHVTVPVLTQVPKAALAAYRVTRTPRTYVLDPEWKLLEVLDGELEGAVAERLAARFHLALPLSGEASREPALAQVPPADGGKSRPRNLCRDIHQNPYSRGAKARGLGLKLQCGEGGVWLPAA